MSTYQLCFFHWFSVFQRCQVGARVSFNLAEFQNCSGSQWVSGIVEGIELDDSADRFDDQQLGFELVTQQIACSIGEDLCESESEPLVVSDQDQGMCGLAEEWVRCYTRVAKKMFPRACDQVKQGVIVIHRREVQ